MDITTPALQHDPAPTLFDTGPLSPTQAVAYLDLLGDGLHPVLCAETKRPIWSDWPHRRPDLDDVIHHDGPIGHIPGELGMVVFDADGGSLAGIDAFCDLHPPLLRVPSRKPGRFHLYYTTDVPVNNLTFVWHNVSGDVRGATGYVILWHDAVVLLRDALHGGGERVAPAPLHLIGDERPSPSAGSSSDTSAPQGQRRSAPPTVSREGSPNPIIFDGVRRWAYVAPKGTHRAAWFQDVREEAHRQNAARGQLADREVDQTAARIADWVWHKQDSWDASHQFRRKDPAARRDGLASGKARRRGTPLEHDRTPWITLGRARATYYRKYRHADPGHQPVPRPRPWIALGISPATFRQRVSRARAGTYRGAKRGVPPWESVGVSQDEWDAWYARPGPPAGWDSPEATPEYCHAFETEPVVARAAPVAPGEAGVPGLCDPMQSALILMEAVAQGADRIPSAGAPPTTDQVEMSKLVVREAQRELNRYISKGRTRLKAALVREAAGIAVDLYLFCLSDQYQAELVRRGLPVHSLRRPRRTLPEYDPTDPAHRQKVARALQQASDHDLRIATRIYERERRLGTAPPTPPWVRAKAEAKLRAVGWSMSREDRRDHRESHRARWYTTVIETEYVPVLTATEAVLEDHRSAA